MTDSSRPAGLERSDTVSALGLRWAALRGMLGSPLIEAEEQIGLREELLRELATLERDFAAVAARSSVEVTAKLDVAKAGLRQAGLAADDWIIQLLESLKADTRLLGGGTRADRGGPSFSRAAPALDGQGSAPAAVEDAAE